MVVLHSFSVSFCITLLSSFSLLSLAVSPQLLTARLSLSEVLPV